MIGIAVGYSLHVLIMAMVIVACCVYRQKHQAQNQHDNT